MNTQTFKKRRFSIALALKMLGMFFAALVMACLALVLVFVVILQNRSVELPQMVRTWALEGLNDGTRPFDGTLPFKVTFDGVELSLRGLTTPVYTFNNVGLFFNEDEPIVQFSTVDLLIETSEIFSSGKYWIDEVYIAGGVFKVTRTEDGRYDYGFEHQNARFSIPNPEQVLQMLEKAFQVRPMNSFEVIQVDQITVEYTDKMTQRYFTIDGARFMATNRDGELEMRSDLSLLNNKGQLSTMTFSYGRSKSGAGTFKTTLDNMPSADIAGQAPFLQWLSLIDAPISGSFNAPFDDGKLAAMNVAIDLGQGTVLPFAQEGAFEFSSAKAYFGYNPKKTRLDVYAVSFDSDWGNVVSGGHAVLLGQDVNGMPQNMELQMQAQAAALNPANVFEDVLDLQNMAVNAKISFNPFQLTVGELSAKVGDTQIMGKGSVKFAPSGWLLEGDLNADEISAAGITKIWPAELFGPMREWFAMINTGSYKNIHFVQRNRENAPALQNISFEFDQLTIPVIDGIQVENAVGHSHLSKENVTLALEHGALPSPIGERLDVSGSFMQIPTFEGEKYPVEFHIRTKGSGIAALSVLETLPIPLIGDVVLVDNVKKGNVDLAFGLGFDLGTPLSPDTVAYSVTGEITDLQLAETYGGKPLSAPNLRIDIDNTKMDVAGDIKIGDAELQTKFTQKTDELFGKMSAQVDVSAQSLSQLFKSVPKGFIDGKARANLEVEIAPNAPVVFDIQSDLKGAQLNIPSINWRKGKNQPASFNLKGSLDNPFTVDQVIFESPDLSLVGAMDFAQDGRLERLELNDTKLKKWFSGDVDFIFHTPNEPFDVQIDNGFVDLRKDNIFNNSGQTGGGGSDATQIGFVTGSFDRIQFTDNIAMTNTVAEIAMLPNIKGRVIGAVNGGQIVNGLLERRGEEVFIEVTAEKAGQMLRDAGVYEHANEGDVKLTLQQTAGVIKGRLTVKDVRIKNAPEMIGLISAVSVIGAFEQADGLGLLFTEIICEFQIKDGLVTVTEFSAVGPSIGLSMDGFVNTNTKELDIQGVFSPFYLVNGLGSFMTGNGEGVVGLNFNISGPQDKPNVNVNLLSLLTPSIFREIFRRPAPKVE